MGGEGGSDLVVEEGEAGGSLAESVGGEEQAPIDDPGLQVGGPVTIYAEIDKEGATIVWRYFFLIQPADLPKRLIGADPDDYLRLTLTEWCGTDNALGNRTLNRQEVSRRTGGKPNMAPGSSKSASAGRTLVVAWMRLLARGSQPVSWPLKSAKSSKLRPGRNDVSN
ncbi:MAG: hypothetical protein ACRDG9_02480 [Actinomycetota bacterium]